MPPMKSNRLSVVAVVVLPLLGSMCSLGQWWTAPESGATVDKPAQRDGTYKPPQGNYSTVFQIKRALGARLDEHQLQNSFETVLSDDFGGWKSIEFMRIGESELPIPADPETRKPYLDHDLKALIERRIAPVVPHAKILHQEYLQKDTPVLFAVLDLKGGSNMMINGKPDDAIRGVYIVIQGAYSYVIATQYSTGVAPVYKKMSKKDITTELNRDLTEFYDGIAFQTDLQVGSNIVAPTTTPAPALNPLEFVPQMKIPDGLFFPNKGSKTFDEAGKALGTKGDWVVYQDVMRSILPVPKGWTTVENGEATYIGFSPKGDPQENPIIVVMVTIIGNEGDSAACGALIDQVVKFVKSTDGGSVLKRDMVDKDRGYVFSRITIPPGSSEAGTHRLFVQAFARNADSSEGGFFHSIRALTDEKDWDTYYPIFRAMLSNWHGHDGAFIGVNLPDSLGK
jgi:hypothetical protein